MKTITLNDDQLSIIETSLESSLKYADSEYINEVDEILNILREDDYDPTPYYLYDNTNGEPQISWKERQDAEQKRCEEQF